jgi:hypothetical protein|tara:strand:- start:162 stop:560 length:399 start_codon:yes stop_codon:yes gene_type:complete
MTEQEIIQLKLSSGEEVLCEIIQWDNDHNATVVVKNAFEIVFLQSPTGAMRLCTLRPFMVGQIEEGYNISLNGDLIVSQAIPTREILNNYRDTLTEYLKFNEGPTDDELDQIEKEEAMENIIHFPIDKSKLH